MARPDAIENDELRAMIEKARDHMKAGQASEAVHLLADAFLRLVELEPEMLSETIEFRPGRKMLAIMRWPALGANLNLASARAGVAEIEFVRDHFAVSEAMTYYEFTLDSAIARGV